MYAWWGWSGLVEGKGEVGEVWSEKRNRFHLIIEHYNRLAQPSPPFLRPSQRAVINHLPAITGRSKPIVPMKASRDLFFSLSLSSF